MMRPLLRNLVRHILPALVGALFVHGAALAAYPPPEPPPDAKKFVQPDGKSFVAGTLTLGIYSDTQVFALWKRNPDGTPDTSFNRDGLATVAFWGVEEGAESLVVQPDGKILVAGHGWDPLCSYSCEARVAVARFNPDGTLDGSFNGDGRMAFVTTIVRMLWGDWVPGNDVGYSAQSVDVLPSGTIEIPGGGSEAFIRLHPDGTFDEVVDNAFGTFAVRQTPLVQAQGLWYASPPGSEPGWGISFAHEGEMIFATWYTFDASGRPWWLGATLQRKGEAIYRGSLYEMLGPPVTAPAYDAATVIRGALGEAALTFSDRDHAAFAYDFGGARQTKQITRQAFGPLPLCAFGAERNLDHATNYQDLWGAPPLAQEQGWGLALAHQGELLFATWYTYDVDRRPLWLAGTAYPADDGAYAGTLSRVTGPAFGAQPWNAGALGVAEVGSFRLAFSDGNAGTFAYRITLGDPPVVIERTKPIVRQVFVEPGTACRQPDG